jgi:hypothetical protein
MAKIRKFLYPHEADLLGLEVKPNLVTKTHKRSQARYYIEPEEWAQISELRNKGVVDSCNSLEVDPTTVKHLWKKTKDESLFVKNPLYKEELEKDFEILKKLIIKDVKKFSPIIKTIKREKTEESFGLVLDPADIHIGKLCTAFETGKEYNSQIAVKRVKEGVKGILNKVSGFNIDKIYFIIGNDILHTDTPKRTTTSGRLKILTECGMIIF